MVETYTNSAVTTPSESGVRDVVLDILLRSETCTGQAFLDRITTVLRDSLAVQGAYICEVAFDWEKPYSVSAHSDDESHISPVAFPREGACDAVVRDGEVVCADAAMQRFPADSGLAALEASAYVGVVLRSESAYPIGVLFVAHRDPMPDAAFKSAVLQTVAPRVAAEVERCQRNAPALRSEARLRLLTERSKDVLFYYQVLPKACMEYISPAVEDIFGCPVEAFHANPSLLLQLPKKQAGADSASPAAPDEPVVARVQRPDGAARWVEYIDFPIRNQDSTLVGIGGVVRDITRRIESEQIAHNSEEYLRALLGAIPETLLLVGADGGIKDYVPGEVPLGLPARDQVLGHKYREVIALAVVGILDRIIRNAVRSNRVQQVEFEVPGVQHRVCEARSIPFGKGEILLVLRDLTARMWHESEEQHHQLRDELDSRVEHIRQANPYGLTYREMSVLHLMIEGLADKQIAEALGISIYTVNKHVGNILGKMNAASRTEAGVRAVREGLVGQQGNNHH